MNGNQVARGLVWFGMGLGVLEVFAPRHVAEEPGLQGHECLLRLFGLLEIGAGVVVLAARDSQRWIWLRTAGDALDGALLGNGLRAGNPYWGRALMATMAVAPVVALDLASTFEPSAGAQRRKLF